MVAGTIMLAMVVIPFVLGITGGVGEDAPNADFSFKYTEAVEPGDHDIFDRDGDDGQGMVIIVYQSGDTFPASELNIAVGDETFNLVEDTDSDTFDQDDDLVPGTELKVRANRGEDVLTIWTTEGDSEVLESFAIRPAGAGWPPGAPTPDHDCDGWEFPDDFDGDGIIEPDGTNHFEIQDVTTACDLVEDDNVEDVTLTNADHIGLVEAGGDLGLQEGIIWGDVTMDGDVLNMDDSGVEGDLSVGGDLDNAENSEIDGDLDVDGLLDSLAESEVNGDLEADSIGQGIENTDIFGSLTAGGSLTNLDESFVQGDLSVDIDLTTSNTIITGDVDAGGTVDITGGEVGGDIDATTVDLENVDVDGDVYVDSADDLTCGTSVTINGQDCDEYKAPHFEVTIVDYNTPVEDGETLEVTAEIENTGLEEGTQDIQLLIDGTQEDEITVGDLGGRTTTIETLEWEDVDHRADPYPVTVASEDDQDDDEVYIYDEGEAPGSFESLTATVHVHETQDELEDVDFSFSLDRDDTVEFRVIDQDGNVIADESEDNEEDVTISDIDEELWVILEADIDDSDCYEVIVSSGTSDPTEYDLEDDWSVC